MGGRKLLLRTLHVLSTFQSEKLKVLGRAALAFHLQKLLSKHRIYFLLCIFAIRTEKLKTSFNFSDFQKVGRTLEIYPQIFPILHFELNI